MPDRSTSRNPCTWTKESGSLCVCCGKCGHNSKQCTDGYLPAWERAYLKEIVFGDPPQVSFVQLGSGEQDHNSTSFGCHHTPVPYQSSIPYATARSNSVSVWWDEEPRFASEFSSMSVNAFYGEISGPNKRPYLENDSWAEQTNNPQQEKADRPKPKGQKKVGKKAEATPLAGLIDEISGAFEKLTSVREVLKRNRVDISLMDWMAWSPSACKELKRLCTRVSKKRQTKPKGPATVTHEIPNASLWHRQTAHPLLIPSHLDFLHKHPSPNRQSHLLLPSRYLSFKVLERLSMVLPKLAHNQISQDSFNLCHIISKYTIIKVRNQQTIRPMCLRM